MATIPFYYKVETDFVSSYDLSVDTTFIGAINDLIDQLLEGNLTTLTKGIKFIARSHVASQALVDGLDVTINDERSQVSFGGAIVDISAGIVGSELTAAAVMGMAGFVGIAAGVAIPPFLLGAVTVAVGAAITYVYVTELEPHINFALDWLTDSLDQELRLYDDQGRHIGGAFHNDGFDKTLGTEREAVNYLLFQAEDAGTVLGPGQSIQVHTGPSGSAVVSGLYHIFSGSDFDVITEAIGYGSGFQALSQLVDHVKINSSGEIINEITAWIHPSATAGLLIFGEAADVFYLKGLDGVPRGFRLDAIDNNTFPLIGQILNRDADNLIIGEDVVINMIDGGAGNDVIFGGDGLDHLYGGADNDILWADKPASNYLGTTNDDLDGGSGKDTLYGNAGNNILNGGDGEYEDELYGFGGNDTLTGGAGKDLLAGGAGTDTASYEFSSSGVTVNLSAGTGAGGDAEGDTLIDIENVVGSKYADTLIGGDTAGTIKGGDGNDTLRGGGKNDVLNGDSGNDVLDGGSGHDVLDGGAGNDVLDGGAGFDVLYGGSGNDVLDGGASADLLYGGSGNDTFTVGNGDYIGDIDSGDIVKINQLQLTGGTREEGSSDPYVGANGETYVLRGSTLTVTSGGERVTIAQFTNGEAGIVLREEPLPPEEEPTDGGGGGGGDGGSGSGSGSGGSGSGSGSGGNGSGGDGDGPYGIPFGDPSNWQDPLVLDLDGDGIELIAHGVSNTYFDLDQDGFAERTGWVSGDDGMLVLDANSDGKINDISELVGSGFVSPSASNDRLNNGPTGFAELATYDLNGDNVIDSADSVWADMHVWRDINSNGLTDDGELLSLEEVGVASISLAHTDLVADPQNALDFGAPNENVIVQQGSFTRTDGTTGTVGDAWLSYSASDTVFNGSVEIDWDVIELPFLMGSGEVKNSVFAMSEDPLLKEMGRDLMATSAADAHLLAGKVEAFILRWAGVDDVNAQSRGQHTNGAYLAAVEKFMGNAFRQLGISANPYPWAGSVMMSNFKQLQSVMMAQILPQIPLGRDLMPELLPGYATRSTLDGGSTLAPMLERMATNAPETPAAQVEYWNTMTLLVHAVKDQLPETDAEIATAFNAKFEELGFGLSYDQIRAAMIGGAGDDVLVGTTDFTGSEAFTISHDNVLFGATVAAGARAESAIHI